MTSRSLLPAQHLPATPTGSPQPLHGHGHSHGHGLAGYPGPPAPLHLCTSGPCAWDDTCCGTRVGSGAGTPRARPGLVLDAVGAGGCEGPVPHPACPHGVAAVGWVSPAPRLSGAEGSGDAEPRFHPAGLAAGSPPPWQPPPFALLPPRAALHPAASLLPGPPLSPPVPPLHAPSPEPLARLHAPGYSWL